MAEAIRSVFQIVNVYEVTAKCQTPLHVGSAKGENGEVLLHPVTGEPFVQASGIAGAFRDFVSSFIDPEQAKEWFGNQNALDGRSRIVFTDGIFKSGKCKLELRTRVKINRETGTTDNAKGGSGQLLKTEYVAAGSELSFRVFEYCRNNTEGGVVKACLKALDSGSILLGGQLSNGCGKLELKKVELISCDMLTAEGRAKWGYLEKAATEDCLKEIRNIEIEQESNIEFSMDVIFDETVLVKGDQVNQDVIEEKTGIRFKDNDRLPDKMQLLDANNAFVIPGSSIKGVFRNHMEMILDYLENDKDNALRNKIFNDRSRLFFYDSYIGGSMNLQVRTRIDKLTGSVADKALFSEAVNGGKEAASTISIRLYKKVLSKEETDAMSALILLTMRDCAIGMVNIGSGYSVGRGFMKVNSITVKEGDEKLVKLVVKKDEKNHRYECTGVGMEHISEWLKSLKKEELV